MKKKTCQRCKETKTVDLFSKNKSKKDGLNGYCKECQKSLFKEHHKNNKEYYKARNKLRKVAIQEFVKTQKGDCVCCDCGFSYPHFVMDYDHISDNKRMSVSELANYGSFDAISKEIEKCELVCANCHRIRTHSRR